MYNCYVGQCVFDDVVSFLSGSGFHLRSVGHGIVAGHELLQADMLFLRIGE